MDIREHGSKNAGMTNVTRTIGKKAGAFTFIVDILKCVVAFVVAGLIFGGLAGPYAGFGAILGHCFPVFLKFRGGKGVSCAIGFIFLVDWRVALIVYIVALIAILILRYISFASLLSTLIAPFLLLAFGHGAETVGIMAVTSVLIWVLHRANIQRLIAGEERKFLTKG
jgi:glycerol-3-phosphate acyltransferase PlsY